MHPPGSCYRHSGRIDPRAISLAPLFLVLAALLGGLYGIAARHVPYVVVKLLLCAAAGAGFGLAAGAVCRRGRVRNLPAALALGFLFALAGWYANWVAWIWSISSEGLWLRNPAFLPTLWKTLAERGVLGDGDSPFPAFAHYLLWGAEALALFALSLTLAAGAVSEAVFCETCGLWTPDPLKLEPLAPVDDPAALRAALERGEFAGLAALAPAALAPAAPGADRFTRLELRRCPGCAALHTVTAATVRAGVDRKGRRSESSERWLKAFVIDAATHGALSALAPPTPAPATA